MIINYIMKSSKIELRYTEQMGRGFFAKEDINANEQIFHTNTQCFITCNRYALFHEFSDLKQSNKISKKVLFAYFLAAVSIIPPNHPAQFQNIKEYFKMLPKELNGLVCWSIQELDVLDNRQLVQMVKSKIKSIQNDYQIIQNKIRKCWQSPKETWQFRLFTKIQQIQLITLSQVIYFYSVIQSRSVHHSCDQDLNSDVGAIAPMLQLFNHSINPQCQVQVGAFHCTVKNRQPIKKDEQIFVSYGNFTEQKFLQMYGFLQTLKKPISCKQNYRYKVANQYNLIYKKRQRI